MVGKKSKTERDDRLLTIGKAASELGVTAATLRNWDKTGKLEAHRHPINSYRLYRASDILALKNSINGVKK